MITRGEYVTNKKAYGVILNHTKQCSEAVLVENNTVVSAYKIDITGKYSYNNTKAKDLVELALDGVKGCNAKNGQALPWEKGTLMEHIFTKKKVEYTVQLYRNELIGMYATKGEDTVRLERSVNAVIPKNIPYIQLTDVKKGLELSENELDAIPTRSVEEIALEKEDVSWLKKKKYYIVNNDEDAEKLFTFLDNYNGVISYDTETTGLKINCFGKIGSSYMADLEKHNAEHPDDKVRADRLVGIIFCVEPDVSYYFPCFNRKFKNLYEDKNSPVRKKIIQNIRARYTVGAGVNQNHIGDMMRYINNTPDDEIRLDVILMERVRHILETKHIAAHHGSFEWKVGWQYEIDTNLKDDSMLMHQLMYKFRSTTANSGEPSNLKYLTKVELGIDQWELKDFFPNWKEDKKGTVRERKDAKSKGTQIDFSYMDYEGSRVYAPADGDFTLQLVLKYKEDMIKNHSEMLYIYDVEMLVSCAIGYMEFYGHRLNESKILGAREDTRANILMIEHDIRSSIGYNGQAEDDLYNQLVAIKDQIKNEKDHNIVDNVLVPQMTNICEKLRATIDADEAHAINLSAPGQVADLFYNKLGYPMPSDKMSVAKKELKALVKERDSEGNLKYPVASLYSKYKNETTLMTKFFDNLPYFMYPGGFIFSSYGQIATATGRMSCIDENSLVMVPGGDVKIKELRVNDQVYCYNDLGELRVKKVLNVIDKGKKECIRLNWIDADSGTKGYLVCTPDHLIRLESGEWVQAGKLNIGDKLCYLARSCEDSIKMHIAGRFNVPECEKNNEHTHYVESITKVGVRHVYDLEIEDYHNFIANEINVHNCNKPNAQQYPKVITKIVVPREDFVMVDADYSQIEYRVLTALAKNEGLAELFADPDSDYHTLMASLMYDVPYASVTPQMRSAAKSFNFGIPYGMGFGSLAILLTGKKTKQTIEEAKEKYEMYFKNQPKTRAFFADIKEMAQVHKYTKTLFNRYRYYTFTDKDGNINEGRKAAALRQAGNAVIQGCLDGDTLIQTKELGIVKIKDAVDTHLHVWDGDKWSSGDILYSGKKRKCIVRFNNGQEFICSPTHKFLVRSHKGNDRFVECKDLLTKETSKNPHRVVVNSKYESSEHKYSSEWAYGYKSMTHNANNVFIENMNTSFEAGMVLGRLASDGSILDREVGGSCILQYVAEHELGVADKLIEYMKPLGIKYADNEVRDGRTEKVNRIYAYSRSLVKEINELDIKHKVHDNIFMDTELLRGFIKGMFDGDGGISGKTISLTFGTQCDFEPMCRDIQKALAFFGIRSRYYKYEYRSKITIKTNDNSKFLEIIGFINDEKQKLGNELECIRDEHIFGQVIIPESVEITDEYIDMYDVCNTDGGYYVADGIITHNTAADIFKISVARNFTYIRKNKLLGLLLIINMVHDEQLMEINSKYLNVTKALADIGVNMQFDIDGFPPLYIGAGCGPAWGYAKGKMAEIHPTLLQNIIDSNRTSQLFKAEPKATVEEDQKKIADMVYEFRRSKVANYLSNPENWHKAIHPAIGGLINLQFNYGRGDDAKAYVGPNGETYSDSEFLELNIADFLKENGINADPKWFSADEMIDEREEEEEEGYDDNDDDEFNPDEMDGELSEEVASVYKKIEEDNSLYGSDISDLVKTFGCVALPGKKIIGFDVRDMNWRNRDALIDWLEPYTINDGESTEGAMEIAFFKEGNIFNKTDIYVKGISPAEAEKQYKIIKNTKKFASVIDYKAGDIHNRSQAK